MEVERAVDSEDETDSIDMLLREASFEAARHQAFLDLLNKDQKHTPLLTEGACLPTVTPGVQQPTCRNMRVRSVRDAHAVFHAVATNLLPMLQRPLDDQERQQISPGDVYVWEEWASDTMDSGSLGAIRRFVDGRSWGPSRSRRWTLACARSSRSSWRGARARAGRRPTSEGA